MSVFKTFGIDSNSAENGKWFEVAPGVKFKIRRFKSKIAQETRADLEKPYATLAKSGALSLEVNTELLAKQLALSVIVDWDGVVGENNELVPFSTQAAYAFMKDERLVELRDRIVEIALAADQYKDGEIKDTLKN